MGFNVEEEVAKLKAAVPAGAKADAFADVDPAVHPMTWQLLQRVNKAQQQEGHDGQRSVVSLLHEVCTMLGSAPEYKCTKHEQQQQQQQQQRKSSSSTVARTRISSSSGAARALTYSSSSISSFGQPGIAAMRSSALRVPYSSSSMRPTGLLHTMRPAIQQPPPPPCKPTVQPPRPPPLPLLGPTAAAAAAAVPSSVAAGMPPPTAAAAACGRKSPANAMASASSAPVAPTTPNPTNSSSNGAPATTAAAAPCISFSCTVSITYNRQLLYSAPGTGPNIKSAKRAASAAAVEQMLGCSPGLIIRKFILQLNPQLAKRLEQRRSQPHKQQLLSEMAKHVKNAANRGLSSSILAAQQAERLQIELQKQRAKKQLQEAKAAARAAREAQLAAQRQQQAAAVELGEYPLTKQHVEKLQARLAAAAAAAAGGGGAAAAAAAAVVKVTPLQVLNGCCMAAGLEVTEVLQELPTAGAGAATEKQQSGDRAQQQQQQAEAGQQGGNSKEAAPHEQQQQDSGKVHGAAGEKQEGQATSAAGRLRRSAVWWSMGLRNLLLAAPSVRSECIECCRHGQAHSNTFYFDWLHE
jgi:hypothetical protein